MSATQNIICQQTESLYFKHQFWLITWFECRLGCKETSLDLVQDTFIQLLKKTDSIEIHQPKAYLSTIAHGLLVNHLRRQDVERAYQDILLSQPQAIVPSLEEREIIVETITTIINVLAKLPQRAQQVFMLAQIEGLPYKQISEQLNISVNMVQKDMSKALFHCYQVVYE